MSAWNLSVHKANGDVVTYKGKSPKRSAPKDDARALAKFAFDVLLSDAPVDAPRGIKLHRKAKA
jgi:hypothetical protein